MNDATRAVLLDPDWFGSVDASYPDAIEEAEQSTLEELGWTT